MALHEMESEWGVLLRSVVWRRRPHGMWNKGMEWKWHSRLARTNDMEQSQRPSIQSPNQ